MKNDSPPQKIKGRHSFEQSKGGLSRNTSKHLGEIPEVKGSHLHLRHVTPKVLP